MKKSKFSETQIVGFLKKADAGMPVRDVCHKTGISEPTYYVWKSKYGGMEASDLNRFKEMEARLSKRKRMYVDLAMENHAMKDLIARTL
jgi:putative transposase